MFKRSLLLLLLAAAVAGTAPLRAGLFFNRKKEPVDVKKRVPELIAALKSDPNPDRRTRAAEELRNYDPQLFPEIVPALIGALKSDAKPSVRGEAARSLGAIRPVSQPAGEALEQALTADPAMRVRLQARSALMQYHWAGYRSDKKPDIPPLGTTREPPLANGGGSPLPAAGTPRQPYLRPVPAPRRVPTTQEPPLAPLATTPPPTSVPAPTPAPTPAPVPVPIPPVESRPLPLPAGPAGGGPELP